MSRKNTLKVFLLAPIVIFGLVMTFAGIDVASKNSSQKITSDSVSSKLLMSDDQTCLATCDPGGEVVCESSAVLVSDFQKLRVCKNEIVVSNSNNELFVESDTNYALTVNDDFTTGACHENKTIGGNICYV